ncbi:AraC family transcriptional regulator [Pseudomonas cichorii]|nr:AraC family transcriptional regulator [Pseudomonas cichorii]
MNRDLAAHLDIALRHASPGLTATPIPRVDICVGEGSTDKAPCLYRSMVCFILQGSKRVAISDSLLSYDSQDYLISALELPLSGQILDAEVTFMY